MRREKSFLEIAVIAIFRQISIIKKERRRYKNLAKVYGIYLFTNNMSFGEVML